MFKVIFFFFLLPAFLPGSGAMGRGRRGLAPLREIQMVIKARTEDDGVGRLRVDYDSESDSEGQNNDVTIENKDVMVPNVSVTLTNGTDITNSTDDATNKSANEKLNLRPIIGILAQEASRSMARAMVGAGLNHSSYIAASYVKAMESAGARVVPILINQSPEYYKKMASSLNGILFPGGSASITNTSGYGRAGDALYQLIMESHSRPRNASEGGGMPLWSTCLGFEMLVYLAGGRTYPLVNCSANDRADPLILTPDWRGSKLFKSASAELMEAVQTLNITSNFHKYCVTPQTFNDLGLDSTFKVVSTNLDSNGKEYVSTIEHVEYPVFGTQWHPEKATFEWKTWGKDSIPHSQEAVALEQHVADTFVQHARRNYNSFSSVEEEQEYLIYNYSPEYCARLYRSSFQQCYFF